MKKFGLIMIVLFSLTACDSEEVKKEDPQVTIDCDQASEEINLLCEDFKSISLLDYDIIYDKALYGSDLETLEWDKILYQYEAYYNMLKPYFDQGLLTFDASEINLLEEDVYEVYVRYSDGFNQELTKSLYVEYRDSSMITKEDGDYVNIAIGSFTHDFGDHTITFDTHPTKQYVFHTKIQDNFEILLNIYVTREDEFMYYDIYGYDVEVFDLGYRVFLWEYVDGVEVETDVYYVFHNDILMEKNYTIEPIIRQDQKIQIPTHDDRDYLLYDFYVDSISGTMYFTFEVSDAFDVYHLVEVELADIDQWYNINHPGVSYNIYFLRVNEFRLHIHVSNPESNHNVHYVVEP